MKLPPFAALAAATASMLQAQTIATAPSVDLSHSTPLSGTWSYGRATDGSEAVFRDPSGRAQLTIRCTRSARRVTITKPASAAAPALIVWTSSQARSVPSSFDPATGLVSAVVSAYDSLLDAIAFSRGRIGANVSGTPTLVMPAWSEIARVVEDCRS